MSFYLFIFLSQYCASKCLVCISPKRVSFQFDLNKMTKQNSDGLKELIGVMESVERLN